jgi:hypothetical protein
MNEWNGMMDRVHIYLHIYTHFHISASFFKLYYVIILNEPREIKFEESLCFITFFLLKPWVTQNFITIKTSWNTKD